MKICHINAIFQSNYPSRLNTSRGDLLSIDRVLYQPINMVNKTTESQMINNPDKLGKNMISKRNSDSVQPEISASKIPVKPAKNPK